MAWVYLFVASLLEIAWTFSVKFMNVKRLRAIPLKGFFTQPANWSVFVPFIGYVIFGVGNVVFFSMAMKEIPTSTGLAVWMGTALVGVKLIELFFFKGSIDFLQIVYMALILIGVVGLKSRP
ncbi:MAG TPA: SMR family transporter [Puia sp.]